MNHKRTYIILLNKLIGDCIFLLNFDRKMCEFRTELHNQNIFCGSLITRIWQDKHCSILADGWGETKAVAAWMILATIHRRVGIPWEPVAWWTRLILCHLDGQKQARRMLSVSCRFNMQRATHCCVYPVCYTVFSLIATVI